MFATALNGDVFDARAHSSRGVIWDRQLYEFDVFGVPVGDPKKDMAMDFIRFATDRSHWPVWRTGCLWARRGVRPGRWWAKNPELGIAMRAVSAHRPFRHRLRRG